MRYKKTKLTLLLRSSTQSNENKHAFFLYWIGPSTYWCCHPTGVLFDSLIVNLFVSVYCVDAYETNAHNKSVAKKGNASMQIHFEGSLVYSWCAPWHTSAKWMWMSTVSCLYVSLKPTKSPKNDYPLFLFAHHRPFVPNHVCNHLLASPVQNEIKNRIAASFWFDRCIMWQIKCPFDNRFLGNADFQVQANLRLFCV